MDPTCRDGSIVIDNNELKEKAHEAYSDDVLKIRFQSQTLDLTVKPIAS